MNHTSLKKTQNKSIYNKNMPKRTPESKYVINFLLDKVKKKKLNFFKNSLDFKRLCTTLTL